MSKAIQRFSLDVTHPDVQASVRTMQGDDNRQWRFTFTEAGRPFILPERCTAMLVGTKPDDTVIENGLVVQGNEVIYDFGAADPENGIEQISTVPGSFEVQILLFDEYGAVLHTPRLWVTVFSSSYTERMANVSMDQLGGIKELIARLVGMEGNVETLLNRLTSQGTVTIAPAQWTDAAPFRADVFMPGDVFGKGCVVLFAPEDDATKEAAGKAMLSMTIGGTVDHNTPTPDYVVIARAESGEAPTIPLNFRYVVLKTGTEDKALVSMVGVDAVGAGGASGGTTSGVDESAVRAIINQVVPAWARASNKPTYNKSEIGLGNVDNVKQYSNSNPPDYPVDSVNGKTGAIKLNADDVGARSSSWMPTAAQVGADPSGTAATKVSDHDTYTGSHNDIRVLIKALQEQVNNFLNVDDTTRDELSEVLALIDANAGTLESLTSSKVNVADIINNLTTNVTNKPLSAAQGVALKALIDALSTGKLDASALNSAITTALAQAKASGDFKGDPGTSVTITNITESTASGGENVVTFSDGKTLKVKNGKDSPSGTGDTVVPLPDYWETHVSEKINEINDLHMAGGKECFSFPLLTDIHIRQNIGKYSGELAKRILDSCYLPYAVCAGDIVNRGTGGEDHMVEDFVNAETLLLPIRNRLLQTQGNHDGAWGWKDYDGDGEADYYVFNFPPEKLHALIYRKVGLVGDCHFDESGTGYWIDDTSNKVRYIILNTHNNKYEEDENGFAVYNTMNYFKFQQSQFDLVIEALSTIPADGWCALTASHVPLNYLTNSANTNSTLANFVLMSKVLNAYKTKTSFNGNYAGQFGWDAISVNVDFTSAKGDYVAHFAGHAHVDSVAVFNGISVITTRCDGNVEPSDSGLTKTGAEGTTNENSFDVFTVNRKEKKIYVTKIGAGDNRYWDYGNGEAFNPDGEPVVTTYTVTNNLTNCTNSNSASTVTEGASYSATITAKSGYVLDSVSVTMGGNAVTVNNGAINIASVTGNIIITATANAEQTGPSYTNIIDTVGYQDDRRLSSSSGDVSSTAAPGYVTTGKISVSEGETLRTRGVSFNKTAYANVLIGLYKADGSYINAYNPTSVSGCTSTVDGEGNLTILRHAGGGDCMVRLCGYGSGANLIVTIDEEIT